MDFSVAIPTYNREDDLIELFESVLKQDALPSEILIIDDWELDTKVLSYIREKAKTLGVSFAYHQKKAAGEPRGLAESRNVAFKLARNEIVFMLDDDLVLKEHFFQNIMKVWGKYFSDENLIGVGGFIENERKKGKLEEVFNKIFGLVSSISWDINEVGFQVWDDTLQEPSKVYYFHGGVASYRKKICQAIGFASLSPGRTALEDVEFCLRAKNLGYYFIILPDALVIHKKSKKSRDSDLILGIKESFNRNQIFLRNCKKSLRNYLWFIWANIGWILRQFLAGNFIKGYGMIIGIFKRRK